MSGLFSMAHRMDWGFGNPNKTAALIVMLMMTVWGLAYVKRWGFWISLVFFLGLTGCLLATVSRGGVVAAMAGIIVLLQFAERPWPRSRWIVGILAAVAFAILAVSIKANSRFQRGIATNDFSISNRLLIWKQVPRMMVDAPSGWGFGNSGDAYMQWYQPIGRSEGYRTLVSSHFTWLVEVDWWGRFLYVFLWIGVFVLLWPKEEFSWFSIPLAIWTAFGICASFSSVAEAWQLWLIPVLALAVTLTLRHKRGAWPRRRLWGVAAFASGLLMATAFLWGKYSGTVPSIHYSNGIVTVGSKSPSIWVISPDRTVLGVHYGHEIRRALNENPSLGQAGVGVTFKWKNIPKSETIVFSRQIPSTFGNLTPSNVILVSPGSTDLKSLNALEAMPNVTAIVGEFSENKSDWVEESNRHPNIKLRVVSGVQEYVPRWINEIAHVMANNRQ